MQIFKWNLHVQVLIKNANISNKIDFCLFVQKQRCFVLSFDILHIDIIHTTNILKYECFVKIVKIVVAGILK